MAEYSRLQGAALLAAHPDLHRQSPRRSQPAIDGGDGRQGQRDFTLRQVEPEIFDLGIRRGIAQVTRLTRHRGGHREQGKALEQVGDQRGIGREGRAARGGHDLPTGGVVAAQHQRLTLAGCPKAYGGHQAWVEIQNPRLAQGLLGAAQGFKQAVRNRGHEDLGAILQPRVVRGGGRRILLFGILFDCDFNRINTPHQQGFTAAVALHRHPHHRLIQAAIRRRCGRQEINRAQPVQPANDHFGGRLVGAGHNRRLKGPLRPIAAQAHPGGGRRILHPQRAHFKNRDRKQRVGSQLLHAHNQTLRQTSPHHVHLLAVGREHIQAITHLRGVAYFQPR